MTKNVFIQLSTLSLQLQSAQRTRNKLEQQNIIDTEYLDKINDEIADVLDQIETIKRKYS